MKRISTILILVLLVTLSLFGCNNQPESEENAVITQLAYASRMYFDSTAEPYERMINSYQSGNYTECIFVKSEEDSHGYGDDVIVAWPTENTELILYNLNNYVSNNSIDLSPFSLYNPITLTDTIEKWEDVNNLLDSFSMSARAYIMNIRNASGYETSEDEENTES